MKLHVPYCSFNILEASNTTTKKQVSTDGITCAKMIMDYFGFEAAEDITELVSRGNSIGVCDASPSVMTDSLVVFLRVHGIRAVKEFYRNTSFDLGLSAYVQNLYDIEARENGIATIIASIAEGVPAIAFVRVSSKEAAAQENSVRTEDYPVVLFGYESVGGQVTGFYYHDPKKDSDESEDGSFIGADDFRTLWTRTAVLLEK